MAELRPAVETPNSLLDQSSGSFTSDVLKLVSGTTFAQAINFLAAPILSRLYLPEVFGTATVFTSIISIFGVIVCLRYELAIMLPDNENDAANLVAVSLVSAFVVSGFTAFILLFAKDSILSLLNAPGLDPYIWLIPLGLLINGVFLALNYWNSRSKQFMRLSIAKVYESLTKNGSQVVLGLTKYAHSGSLIGSSLLGSAVVASVLGAQIWKDDRKIFVQNVQPREIVESVKRYRKFPLIDSWGGFINNLSWQLPVLLLSVYFSQTVVGFYALAYRMIKLPMSLIGASVSQVFFQRASELRSDRTQLVRTVEAVFGRLVAIGLFPSMILAIVGREMFDLILGRNWSEAGIYVQILSIWMFFWFVSSPLSTLFIVLERQELALIVHVSILASRIVALVVGGIYGNIYLALGLFAGSGIIVYGGLTIWNMVLAGVPFGSPIRSILKYLIYASPEVVLLVLIKFWIRPSDLILVLASILTLIMYYLVILYVDPELRSYLKAVFSSGTRVLKKKFSSS